VQALGRQRLCCSANFVALRLRATLAQGLDLYAPMAHRGAHASFSPYHVPTHTPSGTSNPSQSDGFVAVWAAPKLPALPAARLARPPVARDPGRDPRPSPRRRREGAITLADVQGTAKSAVWGTAPRVKWREEMLDPRLSSRGLQGAAPQVQQPPTEEKESTSNQTPRQAQVPVPGSPGTAAIPYAVRQAERINELRALSRGELKAIVDQTTQASFFPALQRHFEKHGTNMGCTTAKEFEQAWRKHLSRQDLSYFTAIRSRDQNRLWYLIAMDTGDVALYNETRGQQWSFLRTFALAEELERRRGHWVVVSLTESGWMVDPW
jgi:hypothetical protein